MQVCKEMEDAMSDKTEESAYVNETIVVSTEPMDIAKLMFLIGGRTRSLNTGTKGAFLSNLSVLIGIILSAESTAEDVFRSYSQVVESIRSTIKKVNQDPALGEVVHTLTCDCDVCKDNVKDLGILIALDGIANLERDIEKGKEGKKGKDVDLKDWDPCQQKPN